MQRPWAGWMISLAVLLVMLIGPLPLHAATMGPIKVENATDLSLPTADIPAGFASRPRKEQQMTAAVLRSLFGTRIQGMLQHDGFAMGYHGWLDGANTPDLPFATYDMYAFGSSRGAQAALTTVGQLVQGLETATQDASLPSNARTWTDGTETYGASNQAFSVSEVAFHRANVLVTVLAFNQGATANGISEALRNATLVAVACDSFLKSRLAIPRQSVVTPLAPLIPLP